MEKLENIIEEIALAFTNSLVKGEYQIAHKMLSSQISQELSPSKLQEKYESMISYIEIGSPVELLDVGVVKLLDNWENKIETNFGWAYISICFDGDVEAVTIDVKKEQNKYVISEIEWGRP